MVVLETKIVRVLVLKFGTFILQARALLVIVLQMRVLGPKV
jgi:hypothetical protein